jgi:hypothetical protein
MPADDQKKAAQTQVSDHSRPRWPRPAGGVRTALVQAGLELARSGGPDAVVLREVTRKVGVVPNAAYRHFADRDALLAAVRDEAFQILAHRMGSRMSQVRPGPRTLTGARLRLQAVGASYLEFARTEPGLFDTAYDPPTIPPVREPTPPDRSNIYSRPSTTSSKPGSWSPPVVPTSNTQRGPLCMGSRSSYADR